MNENEAKPTSGLQSLIIGNEDEVTPKVLDAMSSTDDARLKELLDALVRHMHAFIRESRPTEAEFEAGLRWVTALGQATTDSHNETVLAADILGLSTLVDLINNDGMQGETLSALLGPFYRGDSPNCQCGDSIARSGTPGEDLYMSGRVVDVQGQPIKGAVLDIWQASPSGLYENQDPEQCDFNLRGRFRTDERGHYAFRSVKPAGYPVPVDGPAGELLKAQRRQPMRPAHIHFIVSAPAHKTLITQIFTDDDEAMAADVVFGAKRQICARLQRHESPSKDTSADLLPPFYTAEYDFVLKAGEPCFPIPPIRGKKKEDTHA